MNSTKNDQIELCLKRLVNEVKNNGCSTKTSLTVLRTEKENKEIKKYPQTKILVIIYINKKKITVND